MARKRYNITRDDKFIYLNGFKMAVIIANPESHTEMEDFLEIINNAEFLDIDGDLEDCPTCGHPV